MEKAETFAVYATAYCCWTLLSCLFWLYQTPSFGKAIMVGFNMGVLYGLKGTFDEMRPLQDQISKRDGTRNHENVE